MRKKARLRSAVQEPFFIPSFGLCYVILCLLKLFDEVVYL